MDEHHLPQKYFEDQFDDEEVLFVMHKHPIIMRKGLIFGLSAWLVGPLYTLILTYVNKSNPPTIAFFIMSFLLSVLLGFIILIPSWVGWHFSVLIVTDQRIIQIAQRGFFHRSVSDLSLSQIQSVNYEVSGLEQTLLGFGTIIMQTYVGDLNVHYVHHPARVQKKLLTILRKEGVQLVTYPVGQQPNNVTHEEIED